MTRGWLVGAGLFFASILLVAYTNQITGREISLCPLKFTSGIPCPLCGGTTATFAMVTGNFAEALRFNPLVTLVLGCFVLWSITWLGLGIRVACTLPSPLVTVMILLMLVANWAYILTLP